MQIPTRTYGACPSFDRATPRRGRDGRTGRGRYVTSTAGYQCLRTSVNADLRETCVKRVLFCTFHRRLSCATVVRSRPVLGQAHTPRRRLLTLAALALAVLVVPAVSGANPSHSVTSLRARDAAIAAKSRAAVLGLYSLDSRIAAARRRVATLRGRAVSLRAERASLRLQVKVAERSAKLAQRQLAARIRLLYDQGNVEPLEIVFGAKSLDEAMTSLDNLSRVAGQGEDVVRDLHGAREHLARVSRELASRDSALDAATRDAQSSLDALEGARTARAAYISSLASARRMTQREISSAVAAAQEAQARSASLQQAPSQSFATTVESTPAPSTAVAPAAPPPAAPAATGRTLTVSATGYALSGRTASGLPVGWGIAAVDPSVIPLGTRMMVPGYGEAVAADTGGAIVGATIDLWFPTVAQANAWGRRTVTIVLR